MIMKYQIAFVVCGLAFCVLANPLAKVEPKIWEDLEASETITIIVTFKKANTKAAFERFHSLRLTSRNAILNAQHAILKDHADIIQADVTSMLNKMAPSKKHHLTQLWISNELVVRNVDMETVKLLESHPDVESLIAEQFFPVLPTVEEENISGLDYNNTILNQWGVVNVRAPQAWQAGVTGQGITVGVTDTGSRHTHVNLAPTFRGNNPGEVNNYNWFAPNGQQAPSDTNGHGTHVIGSISGTDGIGVAPQSRWIACRGCGALLCSNADLLGCGNWMACPTDTNGQNPQCGRAPNIVNNSWGGGAGNTFYNAIITAWRNANIVPIFSAGNSGPNCGTVLSPADSAGAIAVGSIAENNQISSFSSIGPTNDGRRKPEIAGPGTSVVSASHLTDTGLRTLSGTSMAGPHVAGVAALILQRQPNLTVDQVLAVLTNGAVPHVSAGTTCGGIPDSVIPNNHVGYGRTDAYYSLSRM